MKKRDLTFLLIGAVAAAFILTATYLIWNQNKMTKVHTLAYPLLLSSDESGNSPSFLPKGTTLYFDKAYPEGITRYKVYVNVDRTPLDLTELNDSTLIMPIDGSVPEKGSLQKLLQVHPLTKQDLQAILKSPHLSKEEIKEVLDDYLKR